MLQQNLAAHQHQNDSTGQFCPLFIARAKEITYRNAYQRQDKGRAADQRNSRPTRHGQESKGHAYSQRIDAGCDGHQQQSSQIHSV